MKKINLICSYLVLPKRLCGVKNQLNVILKVKKNKTKNQNQSRSKWTLISIGISIVTHLEPIVKE